MSLAADLYDDFSNRLARRNRRLAGVLDVLVALTGFAVVGWLLWTGWALYDAAMEDGAFYPWSVKVGSISAGLWGCALWHCWIIGWGGE